jgi:hypothetical protein
LKHLIIKQKGISPVFADQAGLLKMFLQEKQPPHFFDWRDARLSRHSVLLPGCNILDAMMGEIVAPYGLEWRDPTAHVSVIEYTLSVPDRIFSGASGGERRLVRLAMQGKLPPEIVWNTRRGLQSSDIVARVLADAPAIDSVLNGFEKDEQVNYYIDWKNITTTWQKIKGGAFDTLTLGDTSLVLGGIRNGFFLQKYFGNGA